MLKTKKINDLSITTK